MIKKWFIFIVIFASTYRAQAQKKPIDYVNIFIRTGQDGNTYPGAQAHFGMISISPSNTFKNKALVRLECNSKWSNHQF